ncbi:MAG: hypothetical protein JO063_12960, partial [Pseudonocardiales bacterium]|nr:hypothetical protein [Pseudonocardiales bacterium]
LIDALAKLCAVANHAEVPELVPNGSSPNGSLLTTWFPSAGLAATPSSDASPVVHHLGVLMDSLGVVDEGRALFACSVAPLIAAVGKPGEAQEIQRYFDAPATDSEPVNRPASHGNLGARPEPDVEPPPREEPESE